MRKTGPAPQPTVVKLHRANGRTLRKRDRNGEEPRPDVLSTLPEPPPLLDALPGAKETYSEYGKKLIKAGVLTALDLPALIQFAVWWTKWQAAESALAVDQAVLAGDNGGYYQNPLVSIAKQAAQMVDKWGALLGLNPSDRTRLKVAPPEKADFLDD